MGNISPWIEPVQKKPSQKPLQDNRHTDVAIVGGGIAGICTAYYLLHNTRKRVLLLESDKIAHGATGHNAGQIVSYFERQVSALVKEFGLELAASAQFAIDSAWMLLENIYRETGLTTPLSSFTGYAGCQDAAEVTVHLENNFYSDKAHINMESLMIAEESDVAKGLPEKYKGLYSLVPQQTVLSLLETTNPKFIACLSARKGVLNSALFTHELLAYLVQKHPHRFQYYEKSHVNEVVLEHDRARLRVGHYEVACRRVVLCTNGFERFKITNLVGDDVDTKFHHLVRGSVGYMAGYVEDYERPPIAISYLPPRSPDGADALETEPYFYLTRRTLEGRGKKSLVCIGGPEALMDDTNQYSREHPYPEEAQKMIDDFLQKSFKFAPPGKIPYTYKWHGLMGYTPNGLRCVGPEPINPVLLYNLGCNGVGILPSIYGGLKIARFIRGDTMPASLFDPQDSRSTISTQTDVSDRSFFEKMWGKWHRV